MFKGEAVSFLLLLAFTYTFSKSLPITTPQPAPAPAHLKSLNNSHSQDGNSCYDRYILTIKTSCYSPRFTRDHISLKFGDDYGNRVYVPRLDDPSSGTFERCTTDTFEIKGPCTYGVCYFYLYRDGYDGWEPETVTLYGDRIDAVEFTYNTYIPKDVWYGFNLCGDDRASAVSS